MAEVRAGRRRSDRLRAALMVGLALAAGISVTLAPDWERQLHAQNYEMIDSIGAEARRDAETERREVANRLEQARRETRSRKWGTFLALDRNTIRRRRTERGNGFDSQAPGILAGLDRRLSDTLLLGVAAGFKVTDLEFDDVTTLGPDQNPQELGRQRSYTGTIGPYLSYTPFQSWYLNSSFLVGVIGASTERKGDGLVGTARGDTNGYRLSVAGGTGYDWRWRALSFGPQVSLAWDYVHVSGFHERGEPADADMLLRSPASHDDLLTAKAGGHASRPFRFSWGALVPHWRLDFVYRDLGDETTGEVTLLSGGTRTFLRDRPDRTSLEAGLGVQLLLPNALSFWVDYEESFLERDLARDRITVGVRKQF